MRTRSFLHLLTAALLTAFAPSQAAAAGFYLGMPGAVRPAVSDLRATLTAAAPTPGPALMATFTASPADSATPTPIPSLTDSPSLTASPSSTHTPVLSATPSDSPSATPSASTTASPSPSATPSASPTSSQTATRTATRTASRSATRTVTPSATRTGSFTATRTATPTNIPTLVAVLGNGSSGLGSNGPASGSPVNAVRGITGTNQNSLLYFTDYGSNQIRVYNPTGGSIYDSAFSRLTLAAATVALWGGLASGASGSSLTTTPIQMFGPYDVVYDEYQQALYVSESNNNRVLVNFGSGSWFVWAGGGPCCALGDGGPAASARLNSPMGLAQQPGAVEPPLYIADSGNHRVRSMQTISPYNITTVAGTGTAGYLGDGAQARLARLNSPRGVAVHASGDLYIADTMNHVIRRVDGSGIITTVAGGGPASPGYLNGIGTAALFEQPEQLHIEGNLLYVTEAVNHTVRRIDLAGGYAVSTYVGGGATDGPGAQPLNTALTLPRALTFSGGRAFVGTETYLYRFP